MSTQSGSAMDVTALLNAAGDALNSGNIAAAESSYQKIWDSAAHLVAAAEGLCRIRIQQGRFADALRFAEAAAALCPDVPEKHVNCAVLHAELGHVPQMLACRGKAQAAGLADEQTERLIAKSHSNYLCRLGYSPDETRASMTEKHRQWYEAHGAHLPKLAPPERGSSPSGRKKIRIGFVSADLYSHPVGILIYSIFERYDRERFELFAYSNNRFQDSLTRMFIGQCAAWRDIVDLSDAEAAAQVRNDGIDVLIDLSGHTAGNRLRLFCHRPAPVQIGFIGYWETTGIPDIDYVIFDNETAPSEEEGFFVEKVLRFAKSRFYYRAPSFSPEPQVRPESANGGVVFCSFNNIAKLSDPVIATWSAILKRVPAAMLRLKWKTLSDPVLRQKILDAFARNGIGADRLSLEPGVSYDLVLAEYNKIDIALDPFPFSGGMTSLDALWMGKPIVTLRGDRPVGRQTQTFLGILGLQQFVASDTGNYVEIAVALANDGNMRRTVSGHLRTRFLDHALTDVDAYVREFESIMHAVWQMHRHTSGV